MPRACGSTWMRRTAAARACPSATESASRTWTGRIRSRSTCMVLPGLRHRWPPGPRRPDAGCRVRRPRAEYYRGGETPGDGVRDYLRVGEHDDGDGAPDQLNFYKLSFEGTPLARPKLWMTWKHLGTPGFGRLIEANDDLAAYLARRCAEADDFEPLPEVPELSVVCFRRAGGVCGPGARRPPGSPAGRARAGRRRVAHDPAAWGDMVAGRRPQLPRDRSGHRPVARYVAAPGGQRLASGFQSGRSVDPRGDPFREAGSRRILDRQQYIEHVIRQLAAGPVRPA